MNEYQQKRMKSYTLPETVYRQALWAVKDLERMKVRLAELEENCKQPVVGSIGQGVGGKNIGELDLTGDVAVRLATLSTRIAAIEEAFKEIPEWYSEGIRAKLVAGRQYDDEAHLNTWKKWQQIFIFHVACNLGLY